MTPKEPIIADAGRSPQPADTIIYTNSRNNSVGRGLRLAILSGLLLFLAHSPIGLWPLAWLAVAPTIISITRAKHTGQAAWRGYAFGWAFLGPTWYWVGLTINAWTHSQMGWLAWALLTCILAGFYAIWGALTWNIARRTSDGWRIIGTGAAWVFVEWLRTLGPISMPWAQISYTQYRFTPILQGADVTGAYGISFAILLLNGGAAYYWKNRKELQATRYLWAGFTMLGLLTLYGLARMQQTEIAPRLTVAAMQDNLNPMGPFNERQFVQTFAELTAKAAQSKPAPSLFVWSEASAPDDVLHNPDARAMLATVARKLDAGLIVGTDVALPGGVAHSSILFPPDGREPTHYDKQQLVPFGEFIPFRSVWPSALQDSFGFFKTDVAPGNNATLLTFQTPEKTSVAVGPFICYESMYPQYARAMTRQGANLLVTQSNDSWFQSRAAQEQHLAAAVCRAVENRRAVVRATTNGVTCLIDANGSVTAEAPRNQEAYLVGDVTLSTGRSIYTRCGDWFVALCAALIILALAGRLVETEKKPKRETGKS